MANGWCFLLLTLGVCGPSSSVPRQFHVVEELKTWTAAQQHCREEFTDLVTIHNMAEMKKLNETVQQERVWIGLKYETEWHWSLTDRDFYGENKAEFRKWAGGQGQEAGHSCVCMNSGGLWHDGYCTQLYNFMCYNETNSTHPYVLVEDGKTWADAQRYCRENHTDLASVRNQAENDKIKSLTTGPLVWIGLFRDAWVWSDGSSSSFRHWAPNEPNSNQQSPACVEIKSSGHWNDHNCDEDKYFVCYEALPTVEVVSQGPFYSGDDVTLRCDIPKYTGQHQYSWIKDSTPVPGKTTQAITITLPQNAGRYQCHRHRGASSVEPYISRPVAIENQDKLVLVNERKTWKEALEYCRQHHVDLVSVSSEQVQRWVAGWAKGASTTYVWVGLRYSCNLGFWFWVSGEINSCYDNWASDVERNRGCTHHVGAVGKDGGKWISFEENAKHNFICTKEGQWN